MTTTTLESKPFAVQSLGHLVLAIVGAGTTNLAGGTPERFVIEQRQVLLMPLDRDPLQLIDAPDEPFPVRLVWSAGKLGETEFASEHRRVVLVRGAALSNELKLGHIPPLKATGRIPAKFRSSTAMQAYARHICY